MYVNVHSKCSVNIILDELRIGSRGVVIISDQEDDRHCVEVCLICDCIPKYAMDILESVGADWGSVFVYGGHDYYVGVREI